MPVMLEEQLLGRRVVLRYRRDEPGDRPPLSDVVGTLTAVTEATYTVQARTGPRIIDRNAVVAAKPVAANRREILELERISRRGWRGHTQVELDGWLLSADLGWTGRANSALPLGTAGQPLDRQLKQVWAFYDERGLELQIQVPLPARGLLDAELAGRCWTTARPTIMLVRALDPESAVPTSRTDATPDEAVPTSRLDATPDYAWIAGYHYRGGQLPDFAHALLTRHDQVTFASLERDGQTAAIGRGVVDEGWLGITAVDVDPGFRRRGLATQIMRDLFGWGLEHGARSCYLQVDESNTAALTLYAGLGFIEHHRYHYRIAPPS